LLRASVVRHLSRHPEVERVHVVLSLFSLQTMSVELGRKAQDETEGLRLLLDGETNERIVLHRSGDMAASISSGSLPDRRHGGRALQRRNAGGDRQRNLEQPSAPRRRGDAEGAPAARPGVPGDADQPGAHREHAARGAGGAVLYPLTPASTTGPQGMEEIVEHFTARIFDLLPAAALPREAMGTP